MKRSTMCLVVFALGVFPDAPFVLAANRDEYFARPTASAAWWTHEGTEIFGGRDLDKGGTWMGLSRGGRIAVVTNVRDLARPQTGRSRGFLPLDALVSAKLPPAIDVAAHPAFNLLVGDADTMFYVSDDGPAHRVAPGLHGLSNHRLDTSWPKVARGLEALERWNGSTDVLFEMLRDDAPAPDDALPKTGVPLEVERMLSSPFVSMPTVGYGTRCSTVVVRRIDGSIDFEERTWNERGERVGTVNTRLY